MSKYPGRIITTLPPPYTPNLGAATPGVWSIDEAMETAVTRQWNMYDPSFNQNVLLLHGNGTNGAQNNTFLDSSSNNFTITRNGNTTQGSYSPFIQTGWSNYFDGTSDSLLTPGNSSLVLDGDFTIEFFMYLNSLAISAAISSNQGSFTAGAFAAIIGHATASNRISFWAENINASAALITSAPLTTFRWYHVAFVRNSGVISLYLDGVSQGTTSSSATITLNGGSTPRFRIGQYWNGTLNGYISNLRVVKGTAVYTAAFTPPTTALTAITNTSLLTCQSNRFVDNSANAFVMTPSGEVAVQAFSPFLPTVAYTPQTIGGSGYFDGSGDFLTYTYGSELAFGTGNFTVEFWMYATGSDIGILQGETNAGWGLLVFSGTIYWQNVVNISNLLSASAAAYTTSSWNHWALVRSSGTLRLYINGQQVTSVADSTNYSSASGTFTIGRYPAAGSAVTGYLSGLRIVKGTAVYTAAFTPPTAPPTAITNTSLLLNFTNAGVVDSTAKNVLETVGNAQIRTTQRKFGGSSISFDGTGDWLLAPHNVDQMFGTGAFTVEFWLYLNATGAARGLVAKGTGTTGWLVSLDSSNRVVFTYTTSTITSTGTISGTTWAHIAVVREGTGTNQTKIYINGTNDGTATVSTDFNQTNSMYVGADRTGGSALNGYIDDLRISKYARYTDNFTPQTSQWQDQ